MDLAKTQRRKEFQETVVVSGTFVQSVTDYYKDFEKTLRLFPKGICGCVFA